MNTIKIQNGCLFILVLLLIICSFGLTQTQKSVEADTEIKQEVKEQTDSINISNIVGIEESAVDTIENYYQEYYDSLAALKERDLHYFFDDTDPESIAAGNLNQNFLKLSLEQLQNSGMNLAIDQYEIDLVIDNVTPVDANNIVIHLTENQDIVYQGSTDVHSYSVNVINNLRLTKTNETWKIARLERGTALFNLMIKRLKELGLEIENRDNNINQIQSELMEEIRVGLAEQKAARESFVTTQVTADNSYNRIAATDYADQYYSQRNPDYPDYTDLGGNCNNYISQCLIAGGLEEDISGYDQWYPESELGPASSSWVGVDYFYDYSTFNTEGGFKAVVADNLYSGQIGDILQLGSGNEYLHSVIITGLIKNRDGKTVDYLIDSNSVDKKDVPASTYGYPQMRLIRIIGKSQ